MHGATTIAAFALALALPVAAMASGDASAGKALFRTKCAVCHSIDAGQNRLGPTLFGLVGRKAGSVPGYNYSDANRASGKTWDEATLEPYLANPRQDMPGTKMVFAGLPDAGDRANLIAYLATLK